jgi:hypothetical protein
MFYLRDRLAKFDLHINQPTMKKIFHFAFIVLIFPISTLSVQAQFVNRLKNAAERGISRAIEKKVESEMEKVARRQLDKVFKDVYGIDPADSANDERINQIMQSVYSDVEVAESYNFDGFSTIQFSGIDEKGKDIEPFQLTSYLSSDPKITAMEFEEGEAKKSKEGTFTLIYDFNLNVAITLMVNEGQNMRMAYAYDAEMLSAPVETSSATEPQEDPSVSFKKTGNTKTILGYECDEYLIETDENTTLYWVTQSSINSTPAFWGQNNPFLTARMKSANPTMVGQMPSGNMMEAHVTSKKDKSKFDMQVIAIQPDKSKSYVMADYPSIATMKQ